VVFKKRYFADLDRRAESRQPLREAAFRGIITLVFGARDVRHNQSVALKEYMESKMRPHH
jgi:uncharacterized protein YeaO (DUF488 family)